MPPTNTTRELDLSAIEKQLVVLSIQKRVAGNQQAAKMRAQADQIESQAKAQFDLDTAPISAAHEIPLAGNPFFDMRPDNKTMFVRFEVPGPALVQETPVADVPTDPANPLD